MDSHASRVNAECLGSQMVQDRHPHGTTPMRFTALSVAALSVAAKRQDTVRAGPGQRRAPSTVAGHGASSSSLPPFRSKDV